MFEFHVTLDVASRSQSHSQHQVVWIIQSPSWTIGHSPINPFAHSPSRQIHQVGACGIWVIESVSHPVLSLGLRVSESSSIFRRPIERLFVLTRKRRIAFARITEPIHTNSNQRARPAKWSWLIKLIRANVRLLIRVDSLNSERIAFFGNLTLCEVGDGQYILVKSSVHGFFFNVSYRAFHARQYLDHFHCQHWRPGGWLAQVKNQ